MDERDAAQAADSLPRLTSDERASLIRIARSTLEAHLAGLPMPPLECGSPGLRLPRAAFVTLRHRGTGRLRGCRGEVAATRPLAESVRRVAVAAATDDPRFPAVTLAELPQIRIEINALTAPQTIAPGEIDVGRHGLWIVSGPHSGLLLPGVPLAWGWGRAEYLENLCAKAGLPPDAWRHEDVSLFGFEAEVWDED